jgi:hypothetical protein
MTNSKDSLFVQISENNSIVEQSIDTLVESACTRANEASEGHQQQLSKTSELLFLSSLLLGKNHP